MLRVRDAAAEIRLPALPRSVGQARRFVTSRLEELGFDDTSGDPALVTSELVTNAVLHAASTEITVRVAPGDGQVRIEVVDGSPVFPERSAPDEGSSAGRGLFIVEHFCDRWGVEPTASGKIVWFVVTATG